MRSATQTGYQAGCMHVLLLAGHGQHRRRPVSAVGRGNSVNIAQLYCGIACGDATAVDDMLRPQLLHLENSTQESARHWMHKSSEQWVCQHWRRCSPLCQPMHRQDAGLWACTRSLSPKLAHSLLFCAETDLQGTTACKTQQLTLSSGYYHWLQLLWRRLACGAVCNQ